MIAVVAVFCMVTALVVAVGTRSSLTASRYDPWLDCNDDGTVNIIDISLIAKAFGATGNPIAKASILYDSGWLDITDRCGQDITLVHNLNSTDIIVDITGKTTTDGGTHQKHLGLTPHISGWTRTYGGAGYDHPLSIACTSDGGYAMAGRTNSFGAGGDDFYLVKTYACGEIDWNKTYGGTGHDMAFCVIQTSDGGYAIAGDTESFGAGKYDAFVVKVDMRGNTQWAKPFGGTNFDGATAIVQTSDGGYAVAGNTYSYAADDSDFWLFRLDADGNMMWNKPYGRGGLEGAYSLIQTNDGGYAIAGSSRVGLNYYDFWLVKTDANGTEIWNKTYGTQSFEVPYDVIQTSDGGYALAGGTSFPIVVDYPRDFWFVKTDADGIEQWNKTYGGAGLEDAGSVIQTIDGGYALVGYTDSFGAGARDFWLVKVDAFGNMQWNQTYGGEGDDGRSQTSLVQGVDGRLALAGVISSFGAGGGDFELVVVDLESGIAWIDSTVDSITLYRGVTDAYWNLVRVRIWKMK